MARVWPGLPSLKTGTDANEIRPTNKKLAPAKLKDRRVMLAATTSCGNKPSALPGQCPVCHRMTGCSEFGQRKELEKRKNCQNVQKCPEMSKIMGFSVAYSGGDFAQALSLASFFLALAELWGFPLCVPRCRVLGGIDLGSGRLEACELNGQKPGATAAPDQIPNAKHHRIPAGRKVPRQVSQIAGKEGF